MTDTVTETPAEQVAWWEEQCRQLTTENERLRGLAQTPAVTDEMVERAWAGIVGRDIAAICHQASIIRADLKAGLEAALSDTSTDRSATMQDAKCLLRIADSFLYQNADTDALRRIADKLADTYPERDGK